MPIMTSQLNYWSSVSGYGIYLLHVEEDDHCG